MSDLNTQVIEKYQTLLEKDPKSKAFAPLADAYLKLNMIKEARNICETGIEFHPDFAGGHITFAQVLMKEQKWHDAANHLKQAVRLDGENILAFRLLGQCLLKLRHPKKALKAYKMVMFLKPEDEKAQRAIQKLESLTADEFEEELFAFKPLKKSLQQWEDEAIRIEPLRKEIQGAKKEQLIDRFISLADAFISRNDLSRARETLMEAERIFGAQEEILRRLKLTSHHKEDSEPKEPLPQSKTAVGR